jgi:GntR family transcriptional regulator, arabinose operon transcriptional repressor
MTVLQLPKYEQVKRTLIAEIEAGQWTPGLAIPSEAQLLQRFAVSRPTLVRSLQDLVREGYLFRRQGKGTFVAERNARESNGQSHRSVPVFTARHHGASVGSPSELLIGLLRGIQSVLGPAHFDLGLRYATMGSVDEETALYLDKSEPGIALMIEPSFLPQLRDDLLRRGWAVWSVNEPWPEGNSVYIDQERSGYLATRYLIEKRNCRRIGLLNGPHEDYWGFAAKHRGYRAALVESNIEFDPKLARQARHVIDTEAGRSMMRALIDERIEVDGVIGASDSKAIGAVAAAFEARISVPDQLAVIGIDDIFAAHCNPPLPSIALPFEDVGRRAAEEALRYSADPAPRMSAVEVRLKPTLVER